MKQFFCVSFMFISLLSCNNQINNESFNNELVLIPQQQFSVNKYEITVTEFAQFVEEKNYTTTADSFKWSGVFSTEKKWVGSC